MDLSPPAAGGIFQLKCNVEKPPLHCTNVRRALCAAIDRQALIDNVLHGGESVALSVLLPKAALSDKLVPDADPELARRYLELALEELECTRETLPPLVLSYATLEGQKALAQAIANQWQQVLGIRVVLEGYEANTYYSRMGSGQMHIGGAAWYAWHNDPIFNLEHVKSKAARYNATRWEDPVYCALLNAADRQVNEEKREALLRRAEEMIMDELPLIPIYITNYKYMARPELEGVCIGDLGQIDFRWAKLIPESIESEVHLAAR